jgi:glycosyltransferase involved in cell wall biosynthesis
MHTDLSVIVPTYNASKFIQETIESVYSQTEFARELVIVDDASTDDTVEIVERVALSAPVPTKVIRRPSNSGGPVLPMNDGVRASQAGLFTILDHDDLLAPDAVAMYRRAWTQFNQPSLGMVTSDMMVFQGQDTVYGSHFRRPGGLFSQLKRSIDQGVELLPPSRARVLLCAGSCLPAKAVFSKAAWETLGGFTPRYQSAWDEDFVWRVSGRYAVGVIDRVLVRVRRHAGNLSSQSLLVSTELIHRFETMLRETREPALRRILRDRLDKEIFDLAYGSYKECSMILLLSALRRMATSRLRRLLRVAP